MKPGRYLTLILSIFLFSSVYAAVPDQLRQSIDSKLQELQKINAEIEQTEADLKKTQTQQRSLSQELKSLDYNINQVNLNIRSTAINIDKLGLDLEALRYEISDAESQIEIKRTAVIRLLRELQEKDRESFLALVLRNKSLADGFLEMQTISDLNFGLSNEVQDLSLLKKSLDLKFQDRTLKKNRLQTESQNFSNRKNILSDQKSTRNNLLTQTKNQEKLYQQELAALEKKQAAISGDIEKIEDELRRSFDPTLLPAKRPGVLAMPLSGPRITQKFGVISYLYGGKPHNGMDFGAPIGTEIFAAADGVVFAVGDNGRYQYGKHIVIQHENNLTTLYAHLSKSIVVKGAIVKKGDVIGYSGNTGYTVGRGHLHFGLYWAPSVVLKSFSNCSCGLVPIGVTIDPLDYL